MARLLLSICSNIRNFPFVTPFMIGYLLHVFILAFRGTIQDCIDEQIIINLSIDRLLMKSGSRLMAHGSWPQGPTPWAMSHEALAMSLEP